MPVDPSRWEQGSEFFLPEFDQDGDPALPPEAGLYGCGRDALRVLLEHGVRELGWRVFWVPSYFCQTVLKDIKVAGLTLRAYGDSPLDGEESPVEIPSDEKGAVLYLNPFGLRTRRRPLEFDRDALWLIEDHSHDPWSPLATTSDADACIVSLRKTVPIPDGGLLWSPVGHPLPPLPKPTEVRVAASQEKLVGMTLKSRYLEGGDVEKDLFRRFLVSGEGEIAAGDVSSMPRHTRALLAGFPADDWRARRLANYQRLADRLKDQADLEVLAPKGDSAVPFMVVIVTRTASLRNGLRSGLVESRIYSAVLWSLEQPEVEGIRTEDVDLSQRMLAVHCDARYTPEDMDLVADQIENRLAALKEGCA